MAGIPAEDDEQGSASTSQTELPGSGYEIYDLMYLMIIYLGEEDQQKCICRGIRSSLESNEGS